MKFELKEKFALLQAKFDANQEVALIFSGLYFGWMLGVGLAYVIAGGPNFGQAPAFTILLCLPLGVGLALVPVLTPRIRFVVIVIGSIALTILLQMGMGK